MAKKFISIACAIAIVFSLLATPATAASSGAELPEGSVGELPFDIPELPNFSYDSSELEFDAPISSLNSEEGELLVDFSEVPSLMSANALVQEIPGYLTEEGQWKYAEFTLSKGQIFHATLECPQSADLDYGLILCEEDGTSLVPIVACNLSTYIDPQTGKTVDEGISYIHTENDIKQYAIVVQSYVGGSEEYNFKLTISIDIAGSYDSYEPNENPSMATIVSLSTSLPVKGSVSASLNTANDQDWYVMQVKEYGVFNLSAGDYVAEPYYVVDGSKMVLATRATDNYVLDEGTYFIKVYSDKEIEDFTHGSYTLSITDMQNFTTIATAWDIGNWENPRWPDANAIPRGQIVAYYKFTLDTLDKVYASVNLSDTEEKYLVAFTSDGKTVDIAHSPEDIITDKAGINKLYVDIDGTVGSTVYLCIINYIPMSYHRGMQPTIRSRYQEGTSTLSFTGTATNPGHSMSSVIYCDATNNSRIPKTAVVDKIFISNGTSPAVGGDVILFLNPSNAGWVESNTAGQFYLGLEYDVKVRSRWAFMYSQTAFASTQKSNVTMRVNWIADIAENNYEWWTQF